MHLSTTSSVHPTTIYLVKESLRLPLTHTFTHLHQLSFFLSFINSLTQTHSHSRTPYRRPFLPSAFVPASLLIIATFKQAHGVDAAGAAADAARSRRASPSPRQARTRQAKLEQGNTQDSSVRRRKQLKTGIDF